MPPKSPPLPASVIAIAVVVSAALFIQMLDAAAISIALPPMAKDFGVSPVSVGFGITVYVLAASIFIPASAWLADRLGARTLFLGALAGFTVASLLCGLSTTLWQFIAARALQGVAGALMAPVGQLIMLRAVERSQLLRIVNLTSAPMLLAPVIGPPLGGFLATWLSWPWIFFINVPLGLVCIGLALRYFPNPHGERRPFDSAGFLLNASALASVLWGLSGLGAPGGSRLVPLAMVVVGLAIGLVAWRHALRADHPLLSLAPLRHKTFRLTSGLAAILIRLPITAIIFVLPIMLQAGFGMSPFLAGLLFLGHTGGDLLMKLVTTRAYHRFGYRNVLLASTTGMAVFVAACAIITSATPLLLIALILFLSGVCRSFLMTGLTTLTFADIDPSEMPAANSLTQVMLQLGAALGISASGVLLEISRNVTGGGLGAPSPEACRITLAVMATMALGAIPLFMGLPHDAGAELSGHSRGRRG